MGREGAGAARQAAAAAADPVACIVALKADAPALARHPMARRRRAATAIIGPGPRSTLPGFGPACQRSNPARRAVQAGPVAFSSCCRVSRRRVCAGPSGPRDPAACWRRAGAVGCGVRRSAPVARRSPHQVGAARSGALAAPLVARAQGPAPPQAQARAAARAPEQLPLRVRALKGAPRRARGQASARVPAGAPRRKPARAGRQ